MSRLGRLAALVAGGALLAAGAAEAGDGGCAVPPDLAAIAPGLTHSATRIGHAGPLTIVAVGSSSTEGVGASSPELTYPRRLEVELQARFPQAAVHVVNRGKGGEDAAEETARLDRDVVAVHPDLVIWQVGTNAVLRRDDLSVDNDLIEGGVEKLKRDGSDVVLMDLQYAPRVLARPAYADMESIIANVAKRARVGFFRRFEIMRHWAASESAEAAKMIGSDGLHMTDLGYRCLAADLADALAANWSASDPAAERGRLVAGVAAQRHIPAKLAAPAP